MRQKNITNPFRIHGVVEDKYFTDREKEVDRIRKTLIEPASKLLVYGPRRMGKTSALVKAIKLVNDSGHFAFLADLSTASTIADMGNRILSAASKVIGKKWREFVPNILSKLNFSISIKHDSTTGIIIPSLDVNLRGKSTEDQQKTLNSILDAINETANERKISIGIALDEFQELHKFGGQSAEWNLRGAIQRHSNVGYVLAGSREHIIERMINSDGALYKLVDKLSFGPIEREHLSAWIDKRMTACGVASKNLGKQIVEMTGPRTRDIVQVARKCFDLALAVKSAAEDDVIKAFDDIVEEEHDLLHSQWESLTVHKQNVLRAVAAGKTGLTTKETLSQFSLAPSGTVTNAASSLVKTGFLVQINAYSGKKLNTPSGYDFDSPFFKRWVIKNTLKDIGIHQ
jgi:hypothetical protein